MVQLIPIMNGIFGWISFTNFFALCGVILTLFLSIIIFYSRKAKQTKISLTFKDLQNVQLPFQTQKNPDLQKHPFFQIKRFYSDVKHKRFMVESRKDIDKFQQQLQQQLDTYIAEAEKALELQEFRKSSQSFARAATVARRWGEVQKADQFTAQANELEKIVCELENKGKSK